MLQNTGIGKDWKKTLKSQEIISRANKWEWIKLKGFCKPKETISRVKRHPMVWKKSFALYTSMGINI